MIKPIIFHPMLPYFQVMANSVEKIRLAGNSNVMVCERGTMFGYSKYFVFPVIVLFVNILNLTICYLGCEAEGHPPLSQERPYSTPLTTFHCP